MEYIDITNHTLNKIITNNQLNETLKIWINNDKQISEFKTNKNKFKLNNFIKITFNKNIKFENNYKFYFNISKEPKIDIIKNLDLIYNYYIKYLNNYYENKKLKFNQKIIFNNIYEYMNKNNTYDSDTDKHKECQLLARYTLGYQIEYCLRTTDTCNIACEY